MDSGHRRMRVSARHDTSSPSLSVKANISPTLYHPAGFPLRVGTLVDIKEGPLVLRIPLYRAQCWSGEGAGLNHYIYI